MTKRTICAKILFTLIIMALPKLGTAQINDENIRLEVLHKNVIGKEFVFGKWNDKGGTETHLMYLGSVKTEKGKTYKIMNSVWVWGLSCRATSRILIFNGKNQYLGNYGLTTDAQLPTELNNGILIFRNLDPECDKKLVSKINFKKGLPQEFFRECNNKFGDSFIFDGEN
ncbi:hypothetical protein [Flavobacterium johnsoniae]|nr:hypothetical protein [Flavobacterium johnsoniae]